MKKNPKVTKQPSKKRKQLYTAPLHKKRKKLTAPLSDVLVEKEGVKHLVIRKGDTVRIRKGSFKGIEGEVSNVDYKNMRLTIEGVTFEKSDGSSQHFPVQACNCEIINLKNMKDKGRLAPIARRLPETEEEAEA
ncbi:MAG: 50S ribosomal protein L24 [Candidatus Heimdallarchaeota archaeon]|nr:50S ribosomal protein L24 [Candidatus Heimdallarchaeota archaeon]MBY8995972.1 50S ribosomal protein L24 [Candidatus Heimdallarchaeota archaeon]